MQPAQAQGLDVELDPGFGTGGMVLTNLGAGAGATDILIQPDGKIVVTGFYDSDPGNTGGKNFAMVRYNPDGSLDTSFAGDGIFIYEDTEDSTSVAVARASDGNYILGGDTDINNDGIMDWFMAIKVLSDGSGLDPSFQGGVAFLESADPVLASDLILQNDGKILLVGSVDNDGDDFYDAFALVRWNANGIPDANFGITATGAFPGGIVISQLMPGVVQEGDTLALQDSKILVAGIYQESLAVDINTAVARFNMADGSLDTTFGVDGYFTGGTVFPEDMLVQPDLKAVLAGVAPGNGDIGRAALVRLDGEGVFDNSFGDNGVSVLDIGGDTGTGANALVRQADGHFLVAGGTGGSQSSLFITKSFFLARVDADGVLDTGFGDNGSLATSLHTFSGAFGLALRPNGDPVAAGFASPTEDVTSGDRFGLVGYLLSSSGGGGGSDGGGCRIHRGSGLPGSTHGYGLFVLLGALAWIRFRGQRSAKR